MDKKVLAVVITIIIVVSAIGGTFSLQSINNPVIISSPLPTQTPTTPIISPQPSESPIISPTQTPNPTTNSAPTPTPTTSPTAQPTPTTQPTPTSSPIPTSIPTPSPTSNPIPTFQLQNVSLNVGNYNFSCSIKLIIEHMQTDFYNNYFFIAYKTSYDTMYTITSVNQNASGTTTFTTPNLLENTVYFFRVSQGQSGLWSSIQQATTASNIIPYPVPSNVIAFSTISSVMVEWDDLWASGFRQITYIVYHNTVNDSSTAIQLTRTGNHYYIWTVSNASAYSEYVRQYFWVASITPSNIESEKSSIVTAMPQKPIEPTPMTAPKFSLVNQSNGDPVFFKPRIVVNISRMQDYFQNERIVTISGYTIGYKKSSDSIWTTIGNIKQQETAYITALTLPLEQNCTYDFRVCAVNGNGFDGIWSSTQQVTSMANTGTPPKITGLVAYPVLNGVLLEWDSVGLLPSNTFYRVYKNTINDPNTSVTVGEVTTAGFSWYAKSVSDFVAQCFWVVIVNSGGIEGPNSVVSTIPQKPIEPPPMAIP